MSFLSAREEMVERERRTEEVTRWRDVRRQRKNLRLPCVSVFLYSENRKLSKFSYSVLCTHFAGHHSEQMQ